MARPLRLEFSGALYHLTSRGNTRQDIFLDDEDRTLFLSLLSREVEQQKMEVLRLLLDEQPLSPYDRDSGGKSCFWNAAFKMKQTRHRRIK
jgi:hypothetical protein